MLKDEVDVAHMALSDLKVGTEYDVSNAGNEHFFHFVSTLINVYEPDTLEFANGVRIWEVQRGLYMKPSTPSNTDVTDYEQNPPKCPF